PCQLSATTPLRVDVANGSKMVSSSECKTFKWTLQKDYVKEILKAQLIQIQRETVRSFDDNLPLKQLLSTYEDVFAMPTELPPPRAHDHIITLLSSTLSVTAIPYRLPPNQKDAGASETKHLQHLKAILKVMRAHTLYAKQSKCIFLAPKVEYLGHVFSTQEVATDPLMIQAMASWPIPKTLKRLIAEVGFNQIKQAMMSLLVLALPNFEKEFIVKTNASGSGIGAVLHQEGHPIASLRKALSPRHQALSTNEKNFLTVMMALDRWRGYMLDRQFKIKTNHFSLKYLMDQRLTNPL
nr:gypsy/Ty3 retroelement polyprotein [Tanacetum cinerariifolium]